MENQDSSSWKLCGLCPRVLDGDSDRRAEIMDAAAGGAATRQEGTQYPVRIKNPNPALAKFIISQYGGPDGELGASMRYLSQRYSMPHPALKAVLTDIGVEELSHLEMVGTIIHQLTRNMTVDQVKRAGFDTYFVDHTTGVYAQAAGGWPYFRHGHVGDVHRRALRDYRGYRRL